MVSTLYNSPYSVVSMTRDDPRPLTPGETLRRYREQQGWSLRDVARRAGVAHGTVQTSVGRRFESYTTHHVVDGVPSIWGTPYFLGWGYEVGV